MVWGRFRSKGSHASGNDEVEKEPEPPLSMLRDGDGIPALTPAQLVTTLLSEGDMDRLGPDGWSCLHHASSLGMRAHVEALLDGGELKGPTKDHKRVNTTKRTEAALGAFRKGMTALEVAQQVQQSSRSDRSKIIAMLLLGAQAEGWGDWRELGVVDEDRRAVAAGKEAPSRTKSKKVEDTQSVEDKLRWDLRNEISASNEAAQTAEMGLLEAKEHERELLHTMKLREERHKQELERAVNAAEDRMRWEMRNELADAVAKTSRAEMAALELAEQNKQLTHQIDLLSTRNRELTHTTEQAKTDAKNAIEAAELRAWEAEARARAAEARTGAAEASAAAAEQRAAAADAVMEASRAAEMRRRHGTATKAMARMMQRCGEMLRRSKPLRVLSNDARLRLCVSLASV
jgi:hypothetical protein